MKNMVYCFLCNLLLVVFVILASCTRYDAALSVVPEPVFVEYGNGSYTVTDQTMISVENDSQRMVAELFSELFASSAGFVPQVTDCPDKAQIRLSSSSDLESEAYRLYVEDDGVDIYAGGPQGFFYAFQTMRQLLPPEIESDSVVSDVDWDIPAVTIYDVPRFEYRGLMVDVSRYFLPKEDLLEIIDCMAMLKLNNLHLHLTDDNGWRIEIRKYPQLTTVGAWRADRGDVPFPDRKNPVKGEPTPIGGYYTQDDIREIVAYAARRQINVIPEIDMPAHSNSALAAFPQYACPVVDRYIGVLPGLGGGNADIIYCAGNDEVFDFLKDVIDEVCELFPSRYIHLGGDEAWKTYWKKCPRCQKRIADESLADEEALQGWFMSRMNGYLAGKGRVMIGWDEITESVVPEGAVVFGWRDDGSAALKAARQGHRFVLTPSELCYLIRYQGPQWFEPLTYFGNSTLKDIYDYEPVGEDWSDDCRALLMGIQGSMWTEFCDSPDDVTYQIFPRLAALAEVAWSPAGMRDWERFLGGLDEFDRHLDVKEVEYSKAMYNIQHKVTPLGDGRLSVSLECERPDLQIHYTVDGSEPLCTSMRFPGEMKVSGPVVLKAATFFDDGAQAGKTLVLPIEWNGATGCRVISDNPAASLMVNGVRGSLRQTDFEWCHFYDDAVFTIDLGSVLPVNRVVVGVLTNYGMAFHRPAYIAVSVSDNGKDFEPVSRYSWENGDIFCEGNFKEDVLLSFPSRSARYIRIQASSPGVCPEGHIRERQVSKFCFDEVQVMNVPVAKSAARTGFLLCRQPSVLYGEGSAHIDFSRKDSLTVRDRLERRSQKDLIRWATF